MVEKVLQPDDFLARLHQLAGSDDPVISIPDDDAIVSDGDVIITDEEGNPLTPLPPTPPPQRFDDNLAEEISDDDLRALAMDLCTAVQEDLDGREDWETIYKENLKFLGLKNEKKQMPWPGACGCTHPMVLEAVVRYQCRARMKLFPSEGPAKLALTADLTQNSQQIQTEVSKTQKRLNAYLIEEMPELKEETDRLLFSQAQIGYGVKKVFFHPKLRRVTSQFIPAENFVLPFGHPNLETAPRYTEIIRMSRGDLQRLQNSGQYREIEIPSSPEQLDGIESEKAKLSGVEPSQLLDDAVKLFEVHVDMFFEEDQFGDPQGGISPYVVTINEETQDVLAIRRGWRQTDAIRRKRAVFVPFVFVPGDGPYGYGYIHLIGQNAMTVTWILRSLVDAGSLANLQGGFKSNQARVQSQDPIQPGEWRDVNISPDELQNAFKPLIYKEPSQTLLTLMQGMIDEGKSFSSTSDLEISASSQNSPVGTTLSLLERQLEVSNAVQARLYDSFQKELKLIIDLLREY